MAKKKIEAHWRQSVNVKIANKREYTQEEKRLIENQANIIRIACGKINDIAGHDYLSLVYWGRTQVEQPEDGEIIEETLTINSDPDSKNYFAITIEKTE